MLRTKPHSLYIDKIYPRIKEYRGATRLATFLRRVSEIGVEKVQQNETTSVFSEDWQNLIIIDACRHDLYEEVFGKTPYRYTLGSSSAEYVSRSFSEGDFSDIVYITANPHFHESHFKDLTGGREPEEVFHSVFHTYQTDWDEEQGTVMPEPVVRDVKTAEKLFPNKRKIIHFMQPHHPFVKYDIEEEQGFDQYVDDFSRDGVWGLVREGKIPEEEAWEGYKNNLKFVMGYVQDLSESLEGKTMLTADHGNFVGENGLYGHPTKSKAKVLRKVPFKVLE
ncbi:MAG: hypothetical protein ABEJ98_01570 [Candidatus Nanohaloarchaea archaeon]